MAARAAVEPRLAGLVVGAPLVAAGARGSLLRDGHGRGMVAGERAAGRGAPARCPVSRSSVTCVVAGHRDIVRRDETCSQTRGGRPPGLLRASRTRAQVELGPARIAARAVLVLGGIRVVRETRRRPGRGRRSRGGRGRASGSPGPPRRGPSGRCRGRRRGRRGCAAPRRRCRAGRPRARRRPSPRRPARDSARTAPRGGAGSEAGARSRCVGARRRAWRRATGARHVDLPAKLQRVEADRQSSSCPPPRRRARGVRGR